MKKTNLTNHKDIEKTLLDLLKTHFGHDSFRNMQYEIIDSILQKKDSLIIMPTGGGKSICYQLPSLILEGITLVISPLISLMKDQVDSLSDIGIRATYINSSLSMQEYFHRMEEIRKSKYKLVYLSPEALQNSSLQTLMSRVSISHLAVDEAHCISSWGHDFRSAYRNINDFIAAIDQRPVLSAFTATATNRVKNDIVASLDLKNPAFFETGYKRENLSFFVLKNIDKANFLTNYFYNHKNDSGIVYCATRKTTEKLYNYFNKKGLSVGCYHAGLSDNKRRQMQDAFIYDDIKIIFATNAFGMGIDKSNVKYIIHYNMPDTIESYYQEAGRAGRDGSPAECYLLYSPSDLQIRRFLIDQNTGELNLAHTQNKYMKLKQMDLYCHTSKCLQSYILEYFGQENDIDPCGKCSNCSQAYEEIDRSLDAMKVISCVLRMKQRYGVSMVANVLKGSKNKRLLQMNFHKLSTYSLLADMELDDIKQFILKLVGDGYLYQTNENYPVLMVTSLGKDVIMGKERVLQKIPLIETSIDEDRLFDDLRALRYSLSKKYQLPAYMIFTDKSLKEMAKKQPQNEVEFLTIDGVGTNKFKKYGNDFLKLIRGDYEFNKDTK